MNTSTQLERLIHQSDFEFPALEQARNYRIALLRIFAEHLTGRVLEVGAGVGQLTQLLLKFPTIRQLVSIEPNPQFYQRLRIALPNHSIVDGTIHDLKGGENWDAVLSVNVLEHIEDDVRELADYHSLLRPTNGVFCLICSGSPGNLRSAGQKFRSFSPLHAARSESETSASRFSRHRTLLLQFCRLYCVVVEFLRAQEAIV